MIDGEMKSVIMGQNQVRDTISGQQRLWPNGIMFYILDQALCKQKVSVECTLILYEYIL